MNTSQSLQNPAFFLGIDVGKKELFCHLISPDTSRSERFYNTSQGIKALITWAQSHCPAQDILVCFEQTGHYGKALTKGLLNKKFNWLYIVNPQKIKAFSQRRLRRNKSDSADAKLIAQFIQSEHKELRVFQMQSIAHEQIKELNRYIETLTQDNAQLKTKSQATDNPVILRSLNRRIKAQEKDIKDLRKRINTILNNNHALAVQKQLLESIPGVGEITSHTLIAELPDISKFENARQLAAWAGLTPRHHISGTSGRTRTPITKIGSAHIRRNIFMPAMTARLSNPILKDFGDRLKGNGKTPKQVIVAIMRKLLHIIYGVLKSQTPFDGNKRGFFPPASA